MGTRGHFGGVSGPTVEALRLMFQEAKDYLDAQFTTVRDLEEKAGQVIRFNTLVAGLVIAAVSVLDVNASPQPDVAVPLTGGLFLLLGSTAAAVLAYQRSRMALAVHREDLHGALDFATTESAFLDSAIEAYTRGIRENNHRVILRTHRFLAASLSMLVASLVSIVLAATVLIWSGHA